LRRAAYRLRGRGRRQSALPGTACDDGDPCTTNDMYDDDCNCTSTGEPALLTVEIQDNPTPAINCTGSPVTLQVSVSNANPDGVAPTWSSPDNGQLVAGTENSLNPRVSVAGTFVLELTDNSTGCTVSDTIVVALDTLPPLAVAQVDGFIGCTNETATLDATQSDFGPDIFYTWFSVDLADTVGTDALQPVGAGGFYVLTVLNTATGCSAADSVFVVVDEEVPPVLVSPAQVLTCQRDTVPILVSVDLPPGTFSLSWAAQSPAPMPLVENDTIARITEPGFYEVTVVNDLTGCELTIGREVLEDREWPGVALASDRLVLSCVEETAFLEASVDSAHSGLLVYQWQNSEGEHLGTDTTLTVDAPGMYFFQAENAENGCTAIDSVLVSQDVQAPNVVQETADAFNCLSTEVLLSVAPTGEAADFDLSWSSLTGGTVTPLPSTMTATVNAPGTYELTVTSLANGCDSVVLFEVVADTLPPAGEIALPSFLGCLGQTVSLDASSFGNNGDYDIEWSSADGQVSLPTGSFLVNVDAPGTYTLSVTNPENGCQTIVSTTVELDPAAPMAVGTTSNNELSCGSTATLDGTGSSEGDHYDYEWANVDGMGALPVPASVLTATVDEPGSYVFIVTNTNTGCADTSAAVAIIPDLNLPTAAAKVDEVGCDGNAFLSANLPAGATGQWAISGTGEIVDPTANATEVIGLGTAPVTLTWTISLENCPDFSSATVVVQPESAPEAQNDQLVVMRGATQGDLNVLANDVVGGGVTFELLTEPALGHLTDFGNGNLSYTLTTTLFGTAQDEFRYRICNANCPERCAEALVRVTIERDKMEIEVPNGITPNGDGINDALVFDQLLLAPDKYPDNELIIFSRWGDIVFKAGPYGNNWQGTNMEGQNLPDGTYYYVLRLDIGSGEIIKGDVTILR
jgi:large repetitive protein